MLSTAKDSLKKSHNLYLYNKSLTRITSLRATFTHHVEKNQCRESYAGNVDCLSDHNTKQEVTMQSSSHHQAIYNQQGWFTSAQRSNSGEIGQNIFDVLLTNLLKANSIDKQGIFLHKTMGHLPAVKLQAVHATLEDNSKLPPSTLHMNRKVDRYKKHEIANIKVSKTERFFRENHSRTMFLSKEFTKSPVFNCINALHTSASNRVSFDDETSKKMQNRRSFAKDGDEDFNQQHENYNDDFHFESMNPTTDPNHKISKNNICDDPIDFSKKVPRKRKPKRHSQTLHSDCNKEDQDKHASHHSNKVTVSLQKLEKLYPNPKNSMDKIYSTISTEFKDKVYMVKPNYQTIFSDKGKVTLWQATYNVLWPSEMSFTAKAKSKAAASSAASLKCLQYLLSNGKVKNDSPILYSLNELKDILDPPIRIQIQPKLIESVNQVLDQYNEDIVQLLTSSETEANKIHPSKIELTDSDEDINEGEAISPTASHTIEASDCLLDPLRGTPLIPHSKDILDRRNMQMYLRLKARGPDSHLNFPIREYREDIINQVEAQRILVVKGEPGCGKSTQVPQFLLDHFTEHGKGTACNIIITQPRKISAISLAKRVAAERKENLGECVGYQVRLQKVVPSGPSGGILFCSSGVLLRRLQQNPDLLGCSHVILDEAHERDLNTDVLIVFLNRALKRNSELRLIIMSATINAGLFERYFGCNTISVPGFMYPVKMHFLEDIMRLPIRGITHQNMNLANPSVNTEDLAKLIEWISKNKPNGAILCFLPGWSEIRKLKQRLEETLKSETHLILPIHSRLPYSDQLMIFNKPPDGVRKIVLATNIAETSITIDDVVYVVDSCAHKEVRAHDTGGCMIDNQWISKGNVNQRKGRAGRVQPGESYHFITKDKYESLSAFPIPEIMRAALQRIVLECKTYTLEKAAEFFSQLPEPPRTSSVQNAINELIEIGALNKNEDLTALGKRIALFPAEPRLSKAMVYAAIFECLNPILTLTALLSVDIEIFTDSLYDKSPVRKVKIDFDPVSDHLAIAWLFEQWNMHADQDEDAAYQFCQQSQLVSARMFFLKDLKILFSQYLTRCRIMDPYVNWRSLGSNVNTNSTNDEFVRGVLFAGLGRVLQNRGRGLKNGRIKKIKNVMLMQNGRRATLRSDSVNYNREEWPSPYLTYQQCVHSSERRTAIIGESTIISPLAVLLFSEGNIEARNYRETKIETTDVLLTFQDKKNVRLICDKETADLLLKLRSALQNVVRHLIEYRGLDGADNKNNATIELFKIVLINLLKEILNEANGLDDQSEGSIHQA
ncbi:ATP-dependent RNA helicase DHX30-like [Diprion similis]|uniref:ATP-dependent RNA helicase DHX30-like n=1 Tax=Diprion similis TaxID=362088 RepID=UPI001EF97D5C|nr:ATP-dependent RNA helicase DHX30-like [Diprion similis]